MDLMAAAQKLSSVGRFREALEVLQSPDVRRILPAVHLHKAWLLVEVGDTEKAREALRHVENSRATLSWSEKSQLEFVRSRIAKERGDIDSELQHLQKAVSFA